MGSNIFSSTFLKQLVRYNRNTVNALQTLDKVLSWYKHRYRLIVYDIKSGLFRKAEGNNLNDKQNPLLNGKNSKNAHSCTNKHNIPTYQEYDTQIPYLMKSDQCTKKLFPITI